MRVPQSPGDYLQLTNILDKNQRENMTSELQANILELLERCEDPKDVNLENYYHAGLRSGVVFFEEQRAIGACELVFDPDENTSEMGVQKWDIRQISLLKQADQSSLFMALLRGALVSAWRAGANRVEALPLDDISQPRPALPERYDLGEIGFASFFARAGFRRLEALPGSRWGANKV